MKGFTLSTLQMRIISGSVLAVAGLFVVASGGWVLRIVVLLAALIAFYEWINLSVRTADPQRFSLAGLLYIPISSVCFLTIREQYGADMSILFVLMVAASDTCAYVAGKAIGGPKMWESLSPKKTWAGLMGAILGPAIVGVLYALYEFGFSGIDVLKLFFFTGTGLFMGLAGQGGDLIVSFLKRRAGAKDAGALIPGHGGILDRFDAMMLCAPLFLLLIAKVFHAL
ncbi:MAG: phosphatidate cytidylyltransferase [Alphaproteobacteria bacterium]|nr:phosphatidate cytidylyltransferase [Alphaproteobacteria bacterium]